MVVPVPSRHLSALVAPQIRSLGGLGFAIEHKIPHPIRRHAFAGLGQDITDLPVYTGDPTIEFDPTLYSGGAPFDLNSLTPSTTSIFGFATFGGCASGAYVVGGSCFDPSNPNNGLVLNNGQTVWGGTSGVNWASLASQAINTAGQVAKVAELPAGSTLLPNGTVLSSTGSIASMMPLLLIGGGLLLVMVMAGRN